MIRRHVLCCLAALVAASVGRAQGPRLVDSVEAPLAYLSMSGAMGGAVGAAPNAATSGPDGAAAASGAKGASGEAVRAGGVRSLLADPAFDTLFGGSDALGRALALVRGVLARSSGDLEIALTGVVPTVGQPLLVMRVRLQDAEVARLQALFAAPAAEGVAAEGVAAGGTPPLAVPHRQVGARQTYMLTSEANARGGRPMKADEVPPGGLVELALVDNDLLVGNDGATMAQLLTPVSPRTSAGPSARVLAADAGFVALRRRLDLPVGSLLVYGDWQRLGGRVPGLGGPLGTLLAWSGLGDVRAVMASISDSSADGAESGARAAEGPAPGRRAPFVATLLFDFDAPAPTAGPRPGPGGRDGWIGASQPATPRTLFAELVGGGLGSIVLSLDLNHGVGPQRSRGMSRFVHDLQHAFEDFGLDFERNVLGRLAPHGIVQFHCGDAAAGNVAPVFVVRARSRQAAADLLTDVRRAADPRGLGRSLGGRGRAPEIVELHRRGGATPIYVTVADDQVLIGDSTDVLVRAVDEARRSSRPRGRLDAAAQAALQALGSEGVVGVFDLDLGDLVARLVAGPRANEVSRLPMRHIGGLDVQPHERGMVLRVRVCSST